jgi:hypothetical protein
MAEHIGQRFILTLPETKVDTRLGEATINADEKMLTTQVQPFFRTCRQMSPRLW